MKNNGLRIPVVILTLGLIAAVAAHFLTSMIKHPVIGEHDFDFSVTYNLDGETKILEGVYRCRFEGMSQGIDPLERIYSGVYLTDGSGKTDSIFPIAVKDGMELGLVVIFSDAYLMGDEDGSHHFDPYLVVTDRDNIVFDDPEMLAKFDAQIIGWEYPQSLENTFVFSGFSEIHSESMFAMLLVGILVLGACLLFVRKDQAVDYKTLDRISVVLNFLVGLLALPIITLCVWFVQAFKIGADWVYQANLVLPAITVFSIAASVSLRRKGFTKTGFFIQFTGPLLFVVLIILETVTA